MEERTEKVVNLMKPIKTISVPPYKSGEIIKGIKKKLNLILESFSKKSRFEDIDLKNF